MTTTIKKTRESLGMTLTELAKASKVPMSTLCDLENGRVNPSFSNLFKVVTTLNSRFN